MSPGDKSQKAIEEIEELAQTLSEIQPAEAKKIIEDLEGDD